MKLFSELATRCERTPSPDRQIDVDIVFALHPDIGAYQPHCQGEEPIFWNEPYRKQKCPKFTESIDAAMKLRPIGWSFSLRTAEHHENGFVFECWVSWGPETYKRLSAQAPTEALAICAGWLRAHQHPRCWARSAEVTEMLDRVSRALLNQDINRSEGSFPRTREEYYRDMARVAIEAMREPTAPMIGEGVWSRSKNGRYEPRDIAVTIYQTMIDAALQR